MLGHPLFGAVGEIYFVANSEMVGQLDFLSLVQIIH